MTLTEEEFIVIQRVIRNLASREGEDTIGILMKDGAFRELPGSKLVELAKKLDGDGEQRGN